MSGNVAPTESWRSSRVISCHSWLALGLAAACSKGATDEGQRVTEVASLRLDILATVSPGAGDETSLPENTALQGNDDAVEGEAAFAVCLPDAKPGQPGYCVRLGDTWFRVWGATKSGKMPKALATDHRGTFLYSSNMGSAGNDGITVYRTDPLRWERDVELSGSAVEMLVSPDDRALWVSDARGWGRIKRFDTQTWTLQTDIAVPGFPKWMTTTRDGHLLASLWNLDGVARVNWPSGEVTTSRTRRGNFTGKTSKNPRGMALSDDESELYVLNNRDHSLSVLDVATLKEKQRIHIGYAPRHIVKGKAPDTFIVSLTGEDAAIVWDAKQRKVTQRFSVGKRPKTIALSNDGRYLYTANFVGNSVTVVDVELGQSVTLRLNVHKPSGLAVRADDEFVYVSGFCSNDIWAIERFRDGETPSVQLGASREYKPCLTCASTFAGCPFPPGRVPAGDGFNPVKMDAEWGWE